MKDSIRYIKRKKLDVDKYDTCIKNATNSRIYAYSWYLDIVATNWDALVLGDYQAVMPLPWRKKFFIKYIYIPVWTQQLGVFSAATINEETILSFLKRIPFVFRKITIFLNDANKVNSKNVSLRDNFVLNLENSFEKIYSGFSKNRKQSLRKSKVSSIKKHYNQQRLYPLFKDYIMGKSGIEEKDLSILDDLLSICYNKNKAFVIEAQDNDENCLGGAIFLIDNNRLYYLFSALSNEGKKNYVMSSIVTDVINKYAERNCVLDFEGSMIPGIASFFKSFGGVSHPYFQYHKAFTLL